MKILVLQLARLGDIYLTWPTLNALRRNYPDAEIHLLVRSKFAGAAEGLVAVDRVIELDTVNLLEPVFTGNVDVDESLNRVSDFVEGLRLEKYSNIINLSFSPFSSYLTRAITTGAAQTLGYTRFEDGYLAIPDDTSAYFYAQVGVGRSNRAHIADIFAAVAGIEISEKDWNPRGVLSKFTTPNEDFVVVQPGASEAHKLYPAAHWRQIIGEITRDLGLAAAVVGSAGETDLVQDILSGIDCSKVYNFVGKTKPADLFKIFKSAKLFIGGDSVGLHIATMTGTPTLNLSFSSVNFWETGPRAKASRVLWAHSPNELLAPRVLEEVKAMLEGKETDKACIYRQEDLYNGYRLNGYAGEEFSWELIRAIYMGENFPVPETKVIFDSMMRINELAVLACEQIEKIRDPETRKVGLDFLDQSEVLLDSISRICPQVGPMVRWFQTEKVRIGPGSFDEVINKTYDAYRRLQEVSALYVFNEDEKPQGESDDVNK